MEELFTQQIQQLERTIRDLQSQLQLVKEKFMFLRDIQTIEMGNVLSTGSGFRADLQGFWWGAQKFTDISADTTKGTAIGMDGSFYPKDGVSGTIDNTKTATVTDGIITNIV